MEQEPATASGLTPELVASFGALPSVQLQQQSMRNRTQGTTMASMINICN